MSLDLILLHLSNATAARDWQHVAQAVEMLKRYAAEQPHAPIVTADKMHAEIVQEPQP
jgi:hypothetical protein